jgi:hypothetical protein
MEEAFLETAGTESLAESTGGASIRNTNDLLGDLERLTQESPVYYLLGYQPENSRTASGIGSRSRFPGPV